MIPPLDLLAANNELLAELEAAYSRFLRSGQYVLGQEVAGFEEEYAEYCCAPHCVGVSSGLDALHLALRAVGIGAGDEVIVPSNTYIATWLAVTHAGGTLVPVEPDAGTHNITASAIADKITLRTKAVLATNLYGMPVDYSAISELTRDRGLVFLTDNAQAGGARYQGQPVGGLADLECHSFYPTKNLGALGEAGAVTTSNHRFAERIRKLRNYGSIVKYQHEICGFNNRIDELQAGILRVKLRYLNEWNRRRRDVAAIYEKRLSNQPGILLPIQSEWAESAWHLYVVRVEHRDAVLQKMADAGVGCVVHYPVPPHLSEAYKSLEFSVGRFPIAEALANSVLSLPIGPHLSEQDALIVARLLIETIQVTDTNSGQSPSGCQVAA